MKNVGIPRIKAGVMVALLENHYYINICDIFTLNHLQNLMFFIIPYNNEIDICATIHMLVTNCNYNP